MFQAWLRWNKVETGPRAARSGGRRESRRRDRREEAMLEEMTWVSIARLEIESNLNNNALAPGLLHCYRPSAPITPCKPAVGTPRPAPLGILTPEAAADKPGEAAARDYSCSGVADVRVPVSCFWQCSVGFDAGMTIVSICQWSTSCQVLYYYIYMVVGIVPEPIIPSAFYRSLFLPMTIPSYSALLSFI
ncbi:hypothetical protein BJX66DRAFT_169896 [Aspergillus keveii]|uniref:Uncharacterized protein n=1 Tax=Aspergillus keveii TaxID=714993 RepID=A0ABR4G9R1_9EURO